MKRSAGLAAILLTISVTAQIEHAPTVEQCRADQRLWLSKLEDAPIDVARTNLPSFDTIGAWSREMNDCKTVDPENKYRYYNVFAEIQAEQLFRAIHFLQRHNLDGNFIREDAEGKR